MALTSFMYVTFKCDLDLQPTWKNYSNGTSPQGQTKCMYVEVKARTKCDLDLQPTWKNYSMALLLKDKQSA